MRESVQGGSMCDGRPEVCVCVSAWLLFRFMTALSGKTRVMRIKMLQYSDYGDVAHEFIIVKHMENLYKIKYSSLLWYLYHSQ